MKVRVCVFNTIDDFDNWERLRDFVMDHEDPTQRRVLGEQCRNAFEAGQIILTMPAP